MILPLITYFLVFAVVSAGLCNIPEGYQNESGFYYA